MFFVQILSLIAIGTPASKPTFLPFIIFLSISAASFNASSSHVDMYDWILGSTDFIRTKSSFTSSDARISLDINFSFNWSAVISKSFKDTFYFKLSIQLPLVL